MNLYVNPIIANGVPSSPDATTSFGTDQSGTIDRLVFRQNATATPTGRAGLVSVARSWTGLIFPNMSVSQFEKEVFTINSKNAKNGLLAINSNANLENASLSIYSLDGKLLEMIHVPGAGVCRPVISGDYLYAAVLRSPNMGVEASGFVTILNKENKVVSNIGGSEPIYTNGKLNTLQQTDKIFAHPHDVCVDDEGSLYVAQWASGKVYPYKLTQA